MWRENCEVDLAYHVRPVPSRQSGRPAPVRRRGRHDREHPAGPQQAAVGDVLDRRSRQRPHRGTRQDPPRAGRRRGVGQPAGARAWICSQAANRRRLVYNRSRTRPLGELRAHRVRRSHAPDRPAARCDALHRAGHRPGAQEQQEAVAGADPAVHPAAVVHEPPRRRATQVRHRDAGARRRQGDRQTSRRHDQRHGARDLGRRAAQAVPEVRRPRRSPAVGLRASEFRLLAGIGSRATTSPA